jgi:hypothetical protein
VLSKVSRGCQRYKDSDDPKENIVWEAEHKNKCKANYSGSSASIWKLWELRKYLAAVKKSTNYNMQSISTMGTAKV